MILFNGLFSKTSSEITDDRIEQLPDGILKVPLSRFELIDPNGRRVVYYGKVEAQIQDEGRTLKVFIDKSPTIIGD